MTENVNVGDRYRDNGDGGVYEVIGVYGATVRLYHEPTGKYRETQAETLAADYERVEPVELRLGSVTVREVAADYPETGARDTELEQHKADKEAAVRKYVKVADHRDRLLKCVTELRGENRDQHGTIAELRHQRESLYNRIEDLSSRLADAVSERDDAVSERDDALRRLEQSEKIRKDHARALAIHQQDKETLRRQLASEKEAQRKQDPHRGGYLRSHYLTLATQQAVTDLLAAADIASGPIEDVSKAMGEMGGRR